jgi:Mrp family chromosome partitioning ATPase
MGEKHPWVAAHVAAVERLDQRIQQRTAELRREAAARAPATQPDAAGERREELRRREAELKELLDLVRGQALASAEKSRKIERLRAEAAGVEQRLDEVTRRVEQLGPGEPGERVMVLQPAELPFTPVRDDRKRNASLGALLGAALGALLVLSWGYSDRRLRRPQDVAAVSPGVAVPVLGTVPELPVDPRARRALQAADAIHRVRAMLQVDNERDGRRVIGITAPAARSGKTSVAAALGASFAQSGAKTLLIDCDLTGGGLRARLRAAAEAAEQAPPHLAAASDSPTLALTGETPDPDRDMDEMLTGRAPSAGGSNEDGAVALTAQSAADTGLLGYLRGLPLAECVLPTHVPGLSVMPSVGTGREDIARLSPSRIRALIDQARHDFDVVLVDTGPLPDSADAVMVAGAVDKMVVVVPRDEHETKVAQTVEHLRRTQTPIAGFVFNREEANRYLAANAPHKRARRGGLRSRGADPKERYEGSGLLAMEVDKIEERE